MPTEKLQKKKCLMLCEIQKKYVTNVGENGRKLAEWM